MRWRAGCILEAKASEVMTRLVGVVSQRRNGTSGKACCIGFEIVPEMGFSRCTAGHSLVVSVEVGVIVNFEGRRVERSRDLFSLAVSSSPPAEAIESHLCTDDVFERGC